MSVEAALFARVVCTPILPTGTSLKVNKRVVGTVQANGTVSGMEFADLCVFVGHKNAAQVCKLLYATIDGESLGLGVLMVRTLPTLSAYTRFAHAMGRTDLPDHLSKRWMAWRQGYTNPRNRAVHFIKHAAWPAYDPSYPDGHIYDFDHIIPKCEGGGDMLENRQVLALSTHRQKTIIEMRRWNKLGRNRRVRRLTVRRNVRYPLRSHRARYYGR